VLFIAAPPHRGRGGWTWYTGSSGWLYRAAIERILGFRVRGALLHLDPCVPTAWPGFEVRFRHRSARYHVVVENPLRKERGVASLELDGVPLPVSPASVPLTDDGREHAVRVVMG
jgi:cyclic beta-1,2-glucan synthetase